MRTVDPDIDRTTSIPPALLQTAGTEVKAKIRCGDHSMGYSLFYGVWEFFYEHLIFWL